MFDFIYMLRDKYENSGQIANDFDFSDSNNETGYPYFVVPNIVHYILFGINEIQFVHYVSILSVLKNHKPDLIWIHCDCNQLNGEYYKKVIERVKQTNTSLEIRQIEKPLEIFGQKLSKKYFNWHSSDVSRLRILQEFGGIYLDIDMYIVKSLDVFRKFELTLNRDKGQYLSSGVIIANKNARFLKLWIEAYRHYDPKSWGKTIIKIPSLKIMDKFPHLVHRVKRKFAVYSYVCKLIYLDYHKNWKNEFYGIHLFMRGNRLTEQKWFVCPKRQRPSVETFNETIVQSLNNTFGEMCRDLNL